MYHKLDYFISFLNIRDNCSSLVLMVRSLRNTLFIYTDNTNITAKMFISCLHFADYIFVWDRRIFLVSLILQGVGLIVNQSVVVPENTFYITVRA